MIIERLSAGDRLMLAADEAWPQEIGALVILDGEVSLEVLRRRVERRLHLVPRFRQVVLRPGRWLGGPLWVDARQFDLAMHVRTTSVQAPGTDTELLACVERLRRQRLDPSRPGWEMWLLTGLPDHRTGLFVKVHHALADGMAAMTLIGAFLDGAAGADTPAPPWRPARPPRPSQLTADAFRSQLHSVAGWFAVLLHAGVAWRRLRATMPAARELLAEEPPPPTSLDHVLGADRRLAILRTSLAELRAIGRAHDATVNDVLLTLTAGGLRALLIGRGESVDGVWTPIYVPITMRRRWRGPVSGNRVAQMAVPLPLDIADAGKRLERIAAETAVRKARDRSAVGKLFRNGLTTRLVLIAASRQRVYACSADIPGPRKAQSLLGVTILEVVPILPLMTRVTLGVGAVSYAGAFCIGVTADREAFPDLDTFVAGMEAELRALSAEKEHHAEQEQPRRPQRVADRHQDPRHLPAFAHSGDPAGNVWHPPRQ